MISVKQAWSVMELFGALLFMSNRRLHPEREFQHPNISLAIFTPHLDLPWMAAAFGQASEGN